MNNRVLMAAGLLATASVLGGCASIFGKPFAMKSRADINEVDVNDYFAARLAAGKHHLREGRPAQAAIAFRQASYDPKVAAEAFNGMAISFAKLGRNDLASEYFALAIERDPADERFARNLARFEATLPAMAQPDVVTEMLAQAEPEAPAAAAGRSKSVNWPRVRHWRSALPLRRSSASPHAKCISAVVHRLGRSRSPRNRPRRRKSRCTTYAPCRRAVRPTPSASVSANRKPRASARRYTRSRVNLPRRRIRFASHSVRRTIKRTNSL